MKSVWRGMLNLGATWLLGAALASPAHAAFHLMEITQVIGGVNGDTSAQAIELKMRTTGQNFLQGSARIRVYDAAGANPLLISNFPDPPGNPASGSCRSILLATAAFENMTTPAVDPNNRDYLMTAIPASYLAAGTLTFENGTGTDIWWRVSWGGASYTGPGSEIAFPTGNDAADGTAGTVNPAFAGPLPSTSLQALRFAPGCATLSTTNAADYALTAGAAVFGNNDLESFTVTAPAPIPSLPGWGGALLVAMLAASGATIVAARRARAPS